MAVAAAVAAAATAAGINLVLPPVIKKLASKLGGDVTPAEMENKKIVLGCLIEELIRKVKHDDSDKSKQLLKKLQATSLELDDLFDIYEYDQLEKQGCTSLEWLTIYKCPMLRREPSLVEGVEGDIANRLPQVKFVYTDELLLVHELVQQQAFSSIAHLTLKDFVALPNLEILSSLKNLCIEDCPDVESLPNLPLSLRSLWIENCRDVESLPNLPFSLQLLWIDECPKLKERYEEGGPLFNTISHIPVIYIYPLNPMQR